ncbi:MAG: metal-dependent hydrolase, partial [Gammaproteobacteria bacterium]
AIAGPTAILFVIVLANLPDVDFLLGALVGRPRDWHRGATHTLVAALVVGLVAGAVATNVGRRFLPVFLLAVALYGSHLALDTVMPDRRGEAGVPLLWPFYDGTVYAPVPLPAALRRFLDLPIGENTESFVRSLMTPRALLVFVVEGLLSLPLLIVAWLATRWKDQGKIPRSR